MKTWVLGLTQGISKQTHSLFSPVTFLGTVYLFLTYRKVTFRHPFQHCINAVPQFDFFSLVNRVFPEPTFVRCSPVRLVIFSTSHVILNMCFAIGKVFATVGRYTWRFPTVNTHFELRPLLHQLLWRQSEITVRAKAQLNGYEVCYDRKTSLPDYMLFWTIFMYIFHF